MDKLEVFLHKLFWLDKFEGKSKFMEYKIFIIGYIRVSKIQYLL
ncbi:hypothetical protein [Clostridium sp. VAP41]|nr:hypothetical protein [Clostridium sp. VAP41]